MAEIPSNPIDEGFVRLLPVLSVVRMCSEEHPLERRGRTALGDGANDGHGEELFEQLAVIAAGLEAADEGRTVVR